MATRHDRSIVRLQKQVTELSDALAHLQTDQDLKHLMQIIKRPGWTTPAEVEYLSASLNAMRLQVEAIATLRARLLQGSDLVASTMDPIPPAPATHIKELQLLITDLSEALSELKSDEDLRRLLQIIVKPGWTRPAELAFSEAIVNLLKVQTATLATLTTQVMKCSEMVAETREAVPQ